MFAHSPKIVTDGLVLALDAGNIKSYPGTGTTWYDKSGNNRNGTLNNGPTFNTGSLGNITFDGSNDWLNITGYSPNFSYAAGVNFSFEIWFYLASNTYGMALSSERSGGFGWVWAVRSISNNLVFSWWNGGGWGNLDSSSSQYISPGRWNLGNLVYEASSNNLTFYLNGNNIGTLSAGTIFTVTANFSVIGWDGGGSIFPNPAQMAKFSIYNRALSATEVQQNYNATKGRFGL